MNLPDDYTGRRAKPHIALLQSDVGIKSGRWQCRAPCQWFDAVAEADSPARAYELAMSAIENERQRREDIELTKHWR